MKTDKKAGRVKKGNDRKKPRRIGTSAHDKMFLVFMKSLYFPKKVIFFEILKINFSHKMNAFEAKVMWRGWCWEERGENNHFQPFDSLPSSHI